jgi:hypothetical protein
LHFLMPIWAWSKPRDSTRYIVIYLFIVMYSNL